MLNLKSAEYVPDFGEMRNVYKLLVGNSEKRVHFGSQSVDGKMLINESERKKVLDCGPCLYDHC
jgi:hypothetical protein